MHTSLAHLHDAGACKERYRLLVKSLGGVKSYGKKTPLPYSQILDLNGLDDCLWALAHGDDDAVWICRLAALAFAMRAVRYTDDVRVKKLNKINHLFLHEEESAAALNAAGDAARAAAEAARDAARAAARAAISAARADAWDAADAAWDAADAARIAAGYAAWNAASAAAWAARVAARTTEKKEQIEILCALLFQMEDGHAKAI